jgi:hypothetical protein
MLAAINLRRHLGPHLAGPGWLAKEVKAFIGQRGASVADSVER